MSAGLVTPPVISIWEVEGGGQQFKAEFRVGVVYIVSSGPEGVVRDPVSGRGGKRDRLWEPLGLSHLQHFLLKPHGGTCSPFHRDPEFHCENGNG